MLSTFYVEKGGKNLLSSIFKDMLGRTYQIQEIAEAISAEYSGDSNGLVCEINRIATDSRFRDIDVQSLFFALNTRNNDGHNYLRDAYSKNVRFFVVNHIPKGAFKEAGFLVVDDTLKALQILAMHHRKEIDYPILVITGSNGKTVVKEWLYQLISPEKGISRSPKSYNSQIGVPLSLLHLDPKSDMGIIEAGISLPGEMKNLYEMIKPEFGIITNIHQAHLENFNDQKHLISEKLELFHHIPKLLYRKDYELLHESILGDGNLNSSDKINWSTRSDADFKVSIEKLSSGATVSITGKVEFSFEFPFRDDASLENGIQCALMCLILEMDREVIANRMKSLSPVAMRLEQIQGINNCTLINDSYNSDLTSLEIALHFLNMQQQHRSKTLIISDIFQSGMADNDLYNRVNTMCQNNGIDRIIGIGESMVQYSGIFSIPIASYKSTGDFLEDLQNLTFLNEGILIKGSRSFGFERISRALENRKHETHLDVNLSAMIDNLNFFRSRIQPGTRIMVMVKAFSYGTGTFEIANVLQHHRIDYLAVAYIDEGIALRKRGINLPIMVMNPSIGAVQSLVEYNLEPEIYSLSSLKVICDYCKQTDSKIRIHLKIETGMHRLGLELSSMKDVVKLLNNSEKVKIASIFSHLASSSDPSFDEFTKKQSTRLKECHQVLLESNINSHIHILNSDGILKFPDFQFDMVRLGIGLYGITGLSDFKTSLRSVISLKTRISQIKHVSKGDGIGYDLNYIAGRNMRTATIPIGYADGLARELGNGAWSCEIGDHRAPIIGNICMDMCMLDITDIPDVHEREEVIVISGNRDLYKLAEIRNTIPYEILTSVSERVKRQFYYGD